MKLLLRIVTALLAMVILLYAAMFYSTNNVIEDFKACVSGKDVSNGVEDAQLYKYYNYKADNGRAVDADVEIRRLFVLHNFKKGVMYVEYSCETFDEEGNTVYGAAGIPSKWYIERNNGRWEVVEIEEDP